MSDWADEAATRIGALVFEDAEAGHYVSDVPDKWATIMREEYEKTRPAYKFGADLGGECCERCGNPITKHRCPE